jgi:hypothetical protein
MRSKIGYGVLGVAVAFLLATNPVVVNAHGLIGSAQIKNNSVKSKDIKNNQVKSVDLKDGSVASVDLASGAQSRLAIGTGLSTITAGSSDVNMGDVALKTGGVPGKNQLVKIEVQMQLDHDSALTTGCSASFRLTRDASVTSLDNWSQELYNGAAAEEHNIAFTWTTTQPAGTTSTYHILGSNSCTQSLFPDEDVVTAEAFPLNGSGAAPARAGVHRPANPGHDR